MTNNLFQVIDFDRVLFDTEKFANALIDELHVSQPLLAEKLRHTSEDAYEKEETFFLLHVLREMMSEEFPIFVEKVVRAHGGGATFLLPGALERLEFAKTLTTARPAIGILTYGDEIDQRMKIEIAGLTNVPMVLSPTPNKSDVLRLWQQPDGAFLLPQEFGAQKVTSISLEDDKLRAFDDMTIGLIGIWVNTSSTAETPRHVRRVDDLFASMDYLKSK